MATLNKVMLIGRLTDNPEPPRVLPNSGSTVVKFRFAVGKSRKNPQTGQWENDPNPLFIDCEAFTRPDSNFRITDIISNYTRKGSQIYVEGRLQLDQWDDKATGQKRSKHKIVVEQVQLLDTRQDGGEGGGGMRGPARAMAPVGAGADSPPEYHGEPAPPAAEGDNIPF
jgi:single-strand DNA-binding protein